MRKKQKAFKALACVAGLLAICAAALAAYVPQTAVQVQDEGVYSIHEIPMPEVKAVAVTNGKATFGVMAMEQELVMVSDVEGNYSLSELRAFLYGASHLTGTRENKDLSAAIAYGMESPLARVTVIKSDGGEINFAVLQQNPIDGSYYVFSEERQATYLVPAAQAELFLRREEDFFARTVLPVITTSNYKEVERVEMDFGGNGRNYTLEQLADGFYITSPILQRVSTPVVMEELLRYLSALYADDFIESGADLAAYGFDAYDAKISVQMGQNTYTALLLEREGGLLLMANPADGSVYELETPNLPLLLRDYLVLTKGRAYTYAAGNLRSVAVSDSQQEILFEVSGSGEEMRALVNGITLDGSQFASLVETLNSAGIEGEVAGAPEYGAELRITFTLDNGSIETVEFIPGEAGSYYVTVNGVTNFTTTQAAVETIKEAAFSYR